MIQWLAKYRGDFHQWWKRKGLLVRDLVFQVEVVTVLGPGSRGQINRSGRGSSGGSCKRKREHFQERDDRRNDLFRTDHLIPGEIITSLPELMCLVSGSLQCSNNLLSAIRGCGSSG